MIDRWNDAGGRTDGHRTFALLFPDQRNKQHSINSFDLSSFTRKHGDICDSFYRWIATHGFAVRQFQRGMWEFSDRTSYVHRESKSKTLNSCPQLPQMLTDFLNSFTDKFSGKFATNLCFNIPSHLTPVVTLPYEIWMSENWRWSEICNVINDKSQDSTAKHDVFWVARWQIYRSICWWKCF